MADQLPEQNSQPFAGTLEPGVSVRRHEFTLGECRLDLWLHEPYSWVRFGTCQSVRLQVYKHVRSVFQAASWSSGATTEEEVRDQSVVTVKGVESGTAQELQARLAGHTRARLRFQTLDRAGATVVVEVRVRLPESDAGFARAFNAVGEYAWHSGAAGTRAARARTLELAMTDVRTVTDHGITEAERFVPAASRPVNPIRTSPPSVQEETSGLAELRLADRMIREHGWLPLTITERLEIGGGVFTAIQTFERRSMGSDRPHPHVPLPPGRSMDAYEYAARPLALRRPLPGPMHPAPAPPAKAPPVAEIKVEIKEVGAKRRFLLGGKPKASDDTDTQKGD